MTKWLSTEEVADEMSVHVETIRLQCRNGDWPGAKKFGALWRIPATALDPEPAKPLIAPPSRRSLAQQRRKS